MLVNRRRPLPTNQKRSYRSMPNHSVPSRVCRGLTFLVILGAALLLGRSLQAQDTTEPALKSAFIYTFARFTTWPDDALPAKSTFVACVVGDRALGDALTRAAKDRQIAGHPIKVTAIDAGDPGLRSCHLLYITAQESKQLSSVLGSIRGSPVLSIVEVSNPPPSPSLARSSRASKSEI